MKERRMLIPHERKLQVRMSSALFRKLSYMAEFDERSCNREICHFIAEAADCFEKKYGAIPMEEGEEQE